jgi:signal transduction histidine kinase
MLLANYEAILALLCTRPFCNHPTQVLAHYVQQLQVLGLSVQAYATYFTVLNIIFVCIYFIVAIILFWRRSDDWMALFTSFFLMTFAITFSFNLWVATTNWLFQFVQFLGAASIVVFFYLFPTGRFVPRWTRWLSIGAILYWGFDYFLPPSPFNPYTNSIFVGFLFILFVGAMVIAQVYRYFRVSNNVQRQQTKWVVFGVSIAIGGFIVSGLVYVLYVSSASRSPLADILFYTITYLLLLLIPISIAFAILRSRLWDIDIIINRTLVYGILTASVIALYVLVVFGLGALLQARGNLGLSLLATGLIAVLIQPLHRRLQRAVNHLLYGERDEPYKVISRLGQRLEATLAPEAVLPTIVETVTGALKLPYAAISLKQDGEDVIAASSGRASDELTRLPLVYQGEHLGDLLLAPRARGETFSSADRDLLAELARQAGIAVHAVRLTTDLQRLTNELQHSRTQIVTAREEERRRLRRDLHDGLGSVLASLNWRAGALRLLLLRDPVAADALVVEQQNTIQAAIGDIRRLVYDLRPPALDELGLLGAIRERATKQSTPTERDNALGLRVEVMAPDHLPALPAAVEVAAYRIVQEALTNVVRHAQAQRCCIRLFCADDLLHVEVSDDGVGLPESHVAGVGLLSMRERAAELSGTCEIAPMPEGGTCVRACLPLLKHDQQNQEGEEP